MLIAPLDGYIRQYPPAIRAILRKIRATVHAAAPRAKETVSYRIPAFRQQGMLVKRNHAKAVAWKKK